jgi:molecular chaperone HtpG
MLVSGDMSQSVQMQKVMKAMGHAVPEVKKTLMLNSNHPLVKKLETMHASSPNDSKTEAMARFIADQATMLE